MNAKRHILRLFEMDSKTLYRIILIPDYKRDSLEDDQKLDTEGTVYPACIFCQGRENPRMRGYRKAPYKNMIDNIITTVLALVGFFIEHIQMIQATLQSIGMDWLIWPFSLIVAWWTLLIRTTTILKVFALPAIAVATYYILFIVYNTMIS
jgi:hypothetical protein